MKYFNIMLAVSICGCNPSSEKQGHVVAKTPPSSERAVPVSAELHRKDEKPVVRDDRTDPEKQPKNFVELPTDELPIVKKPIILSGPEYPQSEALSFPPTSMLLENESVLFSFKTKKKLMNIVIDNDLAYLAYRFGTEDKVELQFPKVLDQNSFQLFTYEYYWRGGGPENMGMHLNYLTFKGEKNQFTVYDEEAYNEQGKNEKGVGIRIWNKEKNANHDIQGKLSSVKGSLTEFRYNDKLKGLVRQESPLK